MKLLNDSIIFFKSVIKVVCCYLNHVLGEEIVLNERFAAVLFLVLVHVVDLLYSCLLYHLCAAKTWIVCCVKTAPFCLTNTHLDYC